MSSPRATSNALCPRVPVLKRMASSSASLRAWGPSSMSFSRGRSPTGQSRMDIRFSPRRSLPGGAKYGPGRGTPATDSGQTALKCISDVCGPNMPARNAGMRCGPLLGTRSIPIICP